MHAGESELIDLIADLGWEFEELAVCLRRDVLEWDVDVFLASRHLGVGVAGDVVEGS